MVRTHRLSTIGALMVCMVAAQWNGPLFASAGEGIDGTRTAATDVSSVAPTFLESSRLTSSGAAIALGAKARSHGIFDVPPAESSIFAAQIYRGQPRRLRRERDGSIAAIVIGAVASITGAAILVYANRPECSSHPVATGCGYGTKVVGGAVLSGGIVGLTIGALTWR
ncbi:MAG: hypothetical protein ABJA98_35310 [Acidobacteriota bacterium]